MHERVKPSTDSSILPKTSLHDSFTDAEKELIDKIMKELDTDDVKELEACKAKLVFAEKEIAELKAKLKKALHQLKLEEQTSHNMLAHKQRMDLRNKMEAEDRLANESKAIVKKDDKSVSTTLDAHSKIEVVGDQGPSFKNNTGLRLRSTFSSTRLNPKPSLFFSSPSLNEYEKEMRDDSRSTCFKIDFCGVL